MSNTDQLNDGFTLGPWHVEPLKNSISLEGKVKRLENRLMQTLLFLAQHQNEIVSRQQFFDTVWQGRVVNEEALSRAVSLLRTALDDNSQNPTFIQTVPGKGYRLLAQVELCSRGADKIREEKSIAVLPFINISDDPANEYFSDGVSEEILNSLAQVPDFKVVARTSSFEFKGRNEDLRKIGKMLNVSHLLEGSVRKQGNTVRITAQLIKANDGFHLWSETYDRALENIFAVQDDIAHSVVDSLKQHMLGEVEKSRETEVEVYSVYLQALYFLKPGQNASLEKALNMFQQVTELDPDYAPAWVGIADACWHLISHGAIDKPTALKVAEDACTKALELDNEYAGAHLCKALLSAGYSQNWETARLSMDKARQLAPGSARVWLQAGNLASSRGAIEKATEYLRRALSLDPLNTTGHIWLANNLVSLGEPEEARSVIAQALTISPERSVLHFMLSRILLQQGQPDTANIEMQKEPEGFWRECGSCMVAQFQQSAEQADAMLTPFIERFAKTAPFQIAELYGARHDADNAFDWLYRAIELQDSGLTELFISSQLLELHGDPRWAVFVTKMGLTWPLTLD